MIRFKQLMDYDCFRTCVACIIEVLPQKLPEHVCGPKLENLHKPRSRWGLWQKRTGYTLVKQVGAPIDTYYVGCYLGKSRGIAHAVVCYNGHMVHDPGSSKPTPEKYHEYPYAIYTVEKNHG